MAGYNYGRSRNNEEKMTRVPLASHFWRDPPKPQKQANEDVFTKEEDQQKGQRRSSRLAKRLLYSEEDQKTKDANDQFSDYGTGSERSFHQQNSQDAENSCYSPYSTLSEVDEDLLSDVVLDHTLSPGYKQPDQPDDLDKHLSDLSLQEEELQQDQSHIPQYLNISNLSAKDVRFKFVDLNGVRMLVPLGGFKLPRSKMRSPLKHPFSIAVTTLNVESILLQKGMRINQACPVFKFEPVGTVFCELYPTIAVIHLSIIPSDQDEVMCLCSNNPEKYWELLPSSIVISEDRTKILVKVFRFSYITVIIRQKCLQICKFIRCRAGGRVMIPEAHVSVDFQKGSTSEDVEISVKVCFDREFSSRKFFSSIHENTVTDYSENLAPASPTICLEPHGLYFDQPVKITIPIPNYEEMKHSNAQLRILYSNAKSDTETLNWQYLDTPITVNRAKCKGINVITFEVHHFSFFRAVWDKVSNSLYQAKNSMFYFLISYAMKVQAFCEEFEGDKFALEVICFRDDKKYPLNQTYKFQVGQSQSKLVKPGPLTVTLKSLHFIADVDAGEDENLAKEENFAGWDFEKQFACKFISDQKKVERGTFGKVTITRKNRAHENLFELNLQKYGHENENTPTIPDRWGQIAINELAANFFITDGDNWKKLATHIGFTKTEIKTFFKHTPDPLSAIVSKYKQRGGTADEFVNAIYSVHRDLKIDMTSPSGSKHSRSSNNSSGRGSMPKNKFNRNGHESDTSGTRTSLSVYSSQDSLLSSTRKRPSNNSNSNRSAQESAAHDSASKPKKRRVHLPTSDNMVSISDADGETSESDSEKSRLKKGTDSNSIQFRKDQTKLNNAFLWEISADMDTVTWRALGRSLGVEESTLINIEHAHKSSGFREMSYQVLLHWKEKFPKRCTFGTLYCALSKENMNGAAKKMIEIKRNDSDT